MADLRKIPTYNPILPNVAEVVPLVSPPQNSDTSSAGFSMETPELSYSLLGMPLYFGRNYVSKAV